MGKAVLEFSQSHREKRKKDEKSVEIGDIDKKREK